MSDSLFCYKKRAIRSKIFVFFNMFLTVFTAFPLFMPKSASLPSLFAPSLFLKSDRSYSLLSLYKRVTVNKSLPPLYTKERPWTICSHGSLQKCDDSDLLFSKSNSLFRALLTKNKRFAWKPKSEFPTLQICELHITLTLLIGNSKKHIFLLHDWPSEDEVISAWSTKVQKKKWNFYRTCNVAGGKSAYKRKNLKLMIYKLIIMLRLFDVYQLYPLWIISLQYLFINALGWVDLFFLLAFLRSKKIRT